LETSEGSWNSSSHDALRLPVRPVAEAQGKGGVAPNGLSDSEGAHSWGWTCMLGRENVGWSAVEVWYLVLDHVDVEGLLNQKISTILYLLYVVYLVYRL
jgi:hypothetical protein